MARTIILNADTLWECPDCTHQHVTTEHRPHLPIHPCAGNHGLSVPMVRAGTKSRHVLKEREDYVGSEVGVQTDSDGRAIMSVVTERWDETTDCTVYAPTATI